MRRGLVVVVVVGLVGLVCVAECLPPLAPNAHASHPNERGAHARKKAAALQPASSAFQAGAIVGGGASLVGMLVAGSVPEGNSLPVAGAAALVGALGSVALDKWRSAEAPAEAPAEASSSECSSSDEFEDDEDQGITPWPSHSRYRTSKLRLTHEKTAVDRPSKRRLQEKVDEKHELSGAHKAPSKKAVGKLLAAKGPGVVKNAAGAKPKGVQGIDPKTLLFVVDDTRVSMHNVPAVWNPLHASALTSTQASDVALAMVNAISETSSSMCKERPVLVEVVGAVRNKVSTSSARDAFQAVVRGEFKEIGCNKVEVEFESLREEAALAADAFYNEPPKGLSVGQVNSVMTLHIGHTHTIAFSKAGNDLLTGYGDVGTDTPGGLSQVSDVLDAVLSAMSADQREAKDLLLVTGLKTTELQGYPEEFKEMEVKKDKTMGAAMEGEDTIPFHKFVAASVLPPSLVFLKSMTKWQPAHVLFAFSGTIRSHLEPDPWYTRIGLTDPEQVIEDATPASKFVTAIIKDTTLTLIDGSSLEHTRKTLHGLDLASVTQALQVEDASKTALRLIMIKATGEDQTPLLRSVQEELEDRFHSTEAVFYSEQSLVSEVVDKIKAAGTQVTIRIAESLFVLPVDEADPDELMDLFVVSGSSPSKVGVVVEHGENMESDLVKAFEKTGADRTVLVVLGTLLQDATDEFLDKAVIDGQFARHTLAQGGRIPFVEMWSHRSHPAFPKTLGMILEAVKGSRIFNPSFIMIDPVGVDSEQTSFMDESLYDILTERAR